MKEVDLNNFLPIDQIKIISDNSIYKIEINLGTIICRKNNQKIDYDKIDRLHSFEQEHYEVTLEKVVDYELYVKSKFKEGFEDIKIKLSDIGKIVAYKN